MHSHLSHSGEGTGSGVIRAVFETAIQKMVQDDHYWRIGLDENYYSLATRLESSDSRRAQLKAYGSLIMAAIYHSISPDPVSPFILAYITQGPAALEDREFIAVVAPKTVMSFTDWPSDTSPIPPTVKNITLLANIEIQVRHLLSIHGTS